MRAIIWSATSVFYSSATVTTKQQNPKSVFVQCLGTVETFQRRRLAIGSPEQLWSHCSALWRSKLRTPDARGWSCLEPHSPRLSSDKALYKRLLNGSSSVSSSVNSYTQSVFNSEPKIRRTQRRFRFLMPVLQFSRALSNSAGEVFWLKYVPLNHRNILSNYLFAVKRRHMCTSPVRRWPAVPATHRWDFFPAPFWGEANSRR